MNSTTYKRVCQEESLTGFVNKRCTLPRPRIFFTRCLQDGLRVPLSTHPKSRAPNQAFFPVFLVLHNLPRTALSGFFDTDIRAANVFQSINQTIQTMRSVGCSFLQQQPVDFLTSAEYCKGDPHLFSPLPKSLSCLQKPSYEQHSHFCFMFREGLSNLGGQ